jgi:hypothetical protein
MTRGSHRFLHVANGTSTTTTIEAAGIPGATSIWADPLHDGPVPDVDDATLIEIRSRFLRGLPGELEPDPVNDLRRWREVIANHEAYDELVLWFEHDLFDQLNLIQLLTYIRGSVPAAKTVSLICIDTFPGRPHFRGLGELTASELASLLPMRAPVSDEQYRIAADAWTAFRAPTPIRLADLCRADTSGLPYLAAALERFLQDYPWTDDGLSRTERRLLQIAASGETSLLAAFPRMGEHDSAYHVTDLSLCAYVRELAATSPPLLSLAPGPADGRIDMQRTVRITEAGRAVLRGEQDRIGLCGFDAWRGGVHLHDGAVMWRWNQPAAQIVSAP